MDKKRLTGFLVAVIFPAIGFLSAAGFVKAQPPPYFPFNPASIGPRQEVRPLDGAGKSLQTLLVPPAANLIGEWKFEEGSGNTVSDTSGKGNHGSWNGTGAHWTDEGKYGKAGNFKGEDNYVSIPNSSTLQPSPFTVTGWIRKDLEPDDWDVVVSKKNTAKTEGFEILYNKFAPRGVYMALYNTNGQEINTGVKPIYVNPGEWTHFAFTFSGSVITVYRNGENLGSFNFSGSYASSNNPLTFGRSSHYDGNYLVGALDNIRIYNTALTPAQVVEDLNLGLSTMTEISDDFTGESLNIQNWWTPPPYTTVVSDNQLKMQLGNEVKNRGTDLWSSKRFKGDFQAEIDLVSLQKLQNTAGFVDARFWMNTYEWAGWVSMDLRLDNTNDPRGDLFCQVRYLENGSPVFAEIGKSTLDGIPASANLRLRITRAGNTVSCSYNAGSGFVVLGTKDIPEWADFAFSPYVSSWKGNAENLSTVAVWDNFNIRGTLAEIVGDWYMDESEGQNVADASGKGNNGTATGTSIVYGKNWNGRSFWSQNDKIEIPSSPSLHSDRSITIMGWFYPNVLDRTWQVLFWKGDLPDCPESKCHNREFGLFLNQDGHLDLASTPTDKIGDGNITCITQPGVITAGRWYHLAGVISSDSRSMKIYVNGVEKSSCEYSSANIRTSTGPLKIGNLNPWDYFNGKIDEVKIYDYVRTPFQIHEDMLGWVQTTQSIFDSFDSANLDTNRWYPWKTDPAITVSQRDGGIYMTIPANVAQGGAGVDMKQRISGDFVFDIDMGSFQVDSVNGQVGTAEIGVSQENNWIVLRLVKDNPNDVSITSIDYYKLQNGHVDDGPNILITSGINPRVRLMRVGRVFYGAFYDGYGWKPAFVVNGFRGDSDILSITLNKGKAGNSDKEVKVYFDNLWGVYNNSCVRGMKGNLDCSAEGLVDTADFELFRQVFGRPIGSVTRNGNTFSPDLYVDGNDQIDTADFEIFRSNFGKSR